MIRRAFFQRMVFAGLACAFFRAWRLEDAEMSPLVEASEWQQREEWTSERDGSWTHRTYSADGALIGEEVGQRMPLFVPSPQSLDTYVSVSSWWRKR